MYVDSGRIADLSFVVFGLGPVGQSSVGCGRTVTDALSEAMSYSSVGNFP